LKRARVTWLLALFALAAIAALFATSAGCDVRNRHLRERRKQDRALIDGKWDEYLTKRRLARGRYIDIGVRLVCVVQDDAGAVLIPDKPPLRVVKERLFGGLLDRKTRRIVAPTRAPVTWYCSEDQWTVVLHEGDVPLGQLAYGSEGAGKTTALAMWHYFRWLENLGFKPAREGGQTAPTIERLTMVRDAIFALFPSNWYRHRKTADIIVFADGTKLRLRSTWQQSKKSGSPIQGYNWSWCGRDEGQDQLERHEDIEARGRSAPGGGAFYKQLITCTAKDSSAWRTFRDVLEKAVDKLNKPLWIRRTLLGRRSPFIAAAYWDKLAQLLDPREYQRRVDAEDVGVELAVYFGWTRAKNLVGRTQTQPDVTPVIFADFDSYLRPGARFVLGVAHDPGNIYNTSIVYRMHLFGRVPTWVVVGELQTKQKTARDHAQLLKEYLQRNFSVEYDEPDCGKALCFIDPHGRGEGKTDYQTVYGAFQSVGLDCYSPAAQTGVIKRSARVGMINRLLTGSAAGGAVRLVIAASVKGEPVAPVLVDAFETLEKREGEDDPEGVRPKDETDKTHAPAALGYGLWLFEQEAITQITIRRALAAVPRSFS
jgi:hypothetical protein